MATYLERYRQGEREEVWAELVSLGIAVREEPLYSDAVAVAHDIMIRARYNVDLIIRHLKELNYQFLDGIFLEQPGKYLVEQIDYVEYHYGPLPIVFRAWFEIVGQVCLMGGHPRLSCYIDELPPEQKGPVSDPLVIGVLGVQDLNGEYSGLRIYDDDDDKLLNLPVWFEFAPDDSHKSNYSGGGCSSVVVPSLGFDAPLVSESTWNGSYFLPYLRLCFQWGGFPGFATQPEEAADAQAELSFLTEGLLSM